MEIAKNQNMQINNVGENIVSGELNTIPNDVENDNELRMSIHDELEESLRELPKLIMTYDVDCDHDTGIIKETNEHLEQLKSNLLMLSETMQLLGEYIEIDSDKFNAIEKTMDESSEIIIDGVKILDDSAPKIHGNKIMAFKVVSGVVLGGTIMGGIGSTFGVVPALICMGLGSSGGGLVGYLTKFADF